jgi:hypothetical protein
MDIQSTDRGKSRIKRLNQLMKNPLILKKSRPCGEKHSIKLQN